MTSEPDSVENVAVPLSEIHSRTITESIYGADYVYELTLNFRKACSQLKFPAPWASYLREVTFIPGPVKCAFEKTDGELLVTLPSQVPEQGFCILQFHYSYPLSPKRESDTLLFFRYRWSLSFAGTIFPAGIPISRHFYNVHSWYRLKQDETEIEPETDHHRHKLDAFLPGRRANLYCYHTDNFGPKDRLKIDFSFTLSLATKIWIVIGVVLGLVAGGLLLVDLMRPLLSGCPYARIFEDATQVLTVSGGAVATLIAIRSWFLAAAFETAEQVRVSRIYLVAAASISVLAIFLMLYRIMMGTAVIFAGLICVGLVAAVLFSCLRKEYIMQFPQQGSVVKC